MRAIQKCASRFVAAHPAEAARVLEQQRTVEAAGWIEALPPPVAAGVIERMSLATAVGYLAAIGPENSAVLINALPGGAAVSLLRRLNTPARNAILEFLTDDSAERYRSLIAYPEDTVGSVADPGALALPQSFTVADARKLIRRHRGAAHHQIFLLDDAQQLVGVVHIRDLVAGRAKEELSAIMRPASARLAAGRRLAGAAEHPAWRKLDVLPVVDDAGRLVGMVRYRQLRRLDVVPASSWLTHAVVGMGELYWNGLTMFLPVANAGSAPSEFESGISEGRS